MFFVVYLRPHYSLPVTASDAPFSFLETVRLGRGNSWRFRIVSERRSGPVVLIILGMLTHAIPQGSATIDLIIGLARNALAYAVLAAGITALSVAYDRLLARVANDPLYLKTACRSWMSKIEIYSRSHNIATSGSSAGGMG